MLKKSCTHPRLLSTTGDVSLAPGWPGALHSRRLGPICERVVLRLHGTRCATHWRQATLTAWSLPRWSRRRLSRAIPRRSRHAQRKTLLMQSHLQVEHFFRDHSQRWSVQSRACPPCQSKLERVLVDCGSQALEKRL